MKKENYITIQGWMITDLKLSGNKLIIYALIYGFSQDGKSAFNGSYDYIAKAVRITRRTVIKLIKELRDENLVKKLHHKNGNSYKVVKKLHPNSEKITPVASEKNAPNNNIDNNTNTNIAFEIFWEAYGKKKAKPKAKAKWDRLKLAEQQAILKHIPLYKSTRAVINGYQMHPTTYLNGRCWEDEVDEKEIDTSDWCDMKIIQHFGVAGLKKYRGNDFKI